MATANGWEVVGKRNKTILNQQNTKTSKKQVKNAMAKMPSLKELAPVKESPTIFDAFLKKERMQDAKKAAAKVQEKNKKENKENNKVTKQQSQQTKQQQQKNSNKKLKNKPQKEKKIKQSLEDALNQIDCAELKSILSLDVQRFTDTPLIWLKDLVNYLNIKLNIKTNDVVFSGKPVDYPLSSVPTSLQNIISDLFEKCPRAALQVFYEHLVVNCIDDESKGLPTFGHRIVIQCLAFTMPSISQKNFEKFKELRTQYQQRPTSCLTLLWAIGQCGYKDFEIGLKIWLEFMLPIMGIHSFSQYTVDYLDILFATHSDVHSSNKVLGIREFFTVLDVIFIHSANLSPELQKQLLSLYPKIKTVALGPHPEQVLRNFFPSLLFRLIPSAPTSLKRELKSSLLTCLVNDHHCYSVWRQLYTKHLTPSSLLLQHLINKWDNLGSGLPKNVIKTTLDSFLKTNEEIKPKLGNLPAYKACVKSCEDLQRKITVTAMFPWRLLLLVAFLSVGGLLAYDINSSGNFEDSRTGRFLNDVGFVAVSKHGWHRIQIYSVQFYDWSIETIPIYAAHFTEVSRPYIQQFWQYVHVFALYLVDVTEDARNYLSKNVPQLLQWITDNAPVFIQKQSVVALDIWAYLSKNALVFWAWLLTTLQHVSLWLAQNVFTGKLSGENLLRYASTAVETLQHYTVIVYQWINYQLGTLTAG